MYTSIGMRALIEQIALLIADNFRILITALFPPERSIFLLLLLVSFISVFAFLARSLSSRRGDYARYLRLFRLRFDFL